MKHRHHLFSTYLGGIENLRQIQLPISGWIESLLKLFQLSGDFEKSFFYSLVLLQSELKAWILWIEQNQHRETIEFQPIK